MLTLPCSQQTGFRLRISIEAKFTQDIAIALLEKLKRNHPKEKIGQATAAGLRLRIVMAKEEGYVFRGVEDYPLLGSQ